MLISSSAMNQLPLWSGTPTVAKSSGNAQPKDGSPTCKCSRETFGCSTHPRGKDEWIWSQAVSLALRFRSLAKGLEQWTKEICGLQPHESLGKFNPNGSFLKTLVDLFPADTGGPSYPTFPASGMMRDGRVWELTKPAPRTDGKDGGYWPTPDANMGMRGGQNPDRINPERTFTLNDAIRMWPTPRAEHDSGKHRGKPDTLHSAVKTWPTPRASMSHGAGEHGQGGKDLQTEAGGTLHSRWVAWLMGWPLTWCDAVGGKKSRTSGGLRKKKKTGSQS